MPHSLNLTTHGHSNMRDFMSGDYKVYSSWFELLRCHASPEGGPFAEHWNTERVCFETSFGLDFTRVVVDESMNQIFLWLLLEEHDVMVNTMTAH